MLLKEVLGGRESEVAGPSDPRSMRGWIRCPLPSPNGALTFQSHATYIRLVSRLGSWSPSWLLLGGLGFWTSVCPPLLGKGVMERVEVGHFLLGLRPPRGIQLAPLVRAVGTGCPISSPVTLNETHDLALLAILETFLIISLVKMLPLSFISWMITLGSTWRLEHATFVHKWPTLLEGVIMNCRAS
jgi:hypothetical protein